MKARVLFFVGKGGVGKSTNSSLFALKLARSGRQVLLNSIDPAHNLHDIFQLSLDAKPKRIVPGLEAGRPSSRSSCRLWGTWTSTW